MNVLEICGSPRSNGNTEYIMNLCEHEINKVCKPSDRIVYDKITIYHSNLAWCKGCRICFDVSEHKCPCNDDLLMIKNKMEEADIIIIGSPVYVEDISGGIKNWMDRMAFNCHRPFLNGKPVYIYTTSAAAASKHAIKSMKRAIISWGGNVKDHDNYIMGQKMNKEVAERTYGTIIEKRMHKMIEAYVLKSVSLYSLISFNIQKRYWKKKQNTADHNYWLKMNWFELDCIYYEPVKVTFLKKKLAILISKLIVTFFM
jgi:multimeric flavodoxin WrbA